MPIVIYEEPYTFYNLPTEHLENLSSQDIDQQDVLHNIEELVQQESQPCDTININNEIPNNEENIVLQSKMYEFDENSTDSI